MTVRIMGVLNVTPDSFSDGGHYLSEDAAVQRGHQLFAEGARIVDIGGESTRPGATPVPPGEEQRRVLSVVRGLSQGAFQTSIDTIHAETARAAVEAGAVYINDVSGGTYDPAMLDTAAWASALHRVSFIIGHWRGVPDPGHRRSHYDNVVAEVREALAAQAEAAVRAGVDPAHIVIDPGLGFDKTGDDSWRLLAEMDRLTALGYPVLIGASRKRMIADALASPQGPALQTTAGQRDLATSVVTALAARAGVWGVRVHDVAGSAQALAMVRAFEAAERSVVGRGAAIVESAAPIVEAAAPVVESAAPVVELVETPAPRDRITLTGLEVFAHHGVFDFEREQGQRFFIDVDAAVDLRAAAAGDALERTVHYGELAEAVVDAVRRDPVDLIETVAERVAAVALGFAGVAEVRVTVHKPDAPIDATFGDVSVSVVRTPAAERTGEGAS